MDGRSRELFEALASRLVSLLAAFLIRPGWPDRLGPIISHFTSPRMTSHFHSSIVTLILAVGFCGQGITAQEISGLQLDFKKRTLRFQLVVKDLQDAYRVTSRGDIQMLPRPGEKVLADEEVSVAVAKARRGRGRLRISRGDTDFQILVHRDNRLADSTLITGLPFGYNFLPRDGKARPGESWRQEFPAPEADGIGVRAAYQYTLRGRQSSADCPQCVEIEILGLRRFVAGAALEQALSTLPEASSNDFYTEDHPFAVGTVLFDPAEGFIRRFELSANPSMFTIFPVPGIMRHVRFEHVPEGR